MFKIFIFLLFFHNIAFSQLDSLYQQFDKETRFSKLYKSKDKIVVLGSYAERHQENYPTLCTIDEKLKRRTIKKLPLPKNYEQYLNSDNSIDGSLFFLGYNFSGNKLRTLFKFDDTGKMIFSINASLDSLYYTRRIVQTEDSGYLLTGYGINSSLRYYCFLSKLTKNGKTEWYNTFEPDPLYGLLGASVYEQNNAYYLLQEMEKHKTDTPYFYNSAQVIKISKGGVVMKTWKNIDSNSSPSGASFVVDDSDNIIYSSFRYQKIIFDTPNNRSSILNRPTIVCRDKNNSIKWEINIQKSQTKWAGIETIKKLKDGSFLAVGNEYNVKNTDSSYSAYAIKFDNAGKTIWQKSFRKSFYHTTNSDAITDFIELEDGGYIMTGTSYQYMKDNNIENVYGKRSYGWTFRTDSDGNILKQISSIIENKGSTNVSKVYPNPFDNQFKIKLNEHKSTKFILYDLNGKTLNKNLIQISIQNNDEYLFEVSKSIPNGIYFLNIQTEQLYETIRLEKK